MTILYRDTGDRLLTLDELREEVEAEVADLPPETWRDGRFVFEDYLTESIHTGTIGVCRHRRRLRRLSLHPRPSYFRHAARAGGTPLDTTIYRYMDREWTRDELRADVEAEAAGLDPDQWIGGEFQLR